MLIELREDTGIKNIKELYLQLKESIKIESEIILDFSKVRRIDLSLAQLVIVANRESLKQGKSLKLKSVSEDVRKQLYMSGFAKC